jgi:hypothetical protein
MDREPGVLPPEQQLDALLAQQLLVSQKGDHFVAEEELRRSGIDVGAYLTEMRTAAVSAAATRRLAPEGGALAILGSGVQARSHFDLLSRVRSFEEVRSGARPATTSAVSWSREGFLAYAEATPTEDYNLWALTPADSERSPVPIANTEAVEMSAAFSRRMGDGSPTSPTSRAISRSTSLASTRRAAA